MIGQGHLRAYAQYAELIWRQLDALEGHDLDRVAEIADRRRELEAIITALPPLFDLPASVLDALAAQIERGLDADALLRQRLAEHRLELHGQLLDGLRRPPAFLHRPGLGRSPPAQAHAAG